MWIYTKPRSEHDSRFLLNLDHCSRINISQLGERWFIEAMLESESIPVAAAGSQEEATALLKQVFDGLKSGEKALDLDALPRGESEEEQETPPATPLSEAVAAQQT